MFLTTLPDEFVFEQTMMNPEFANLLSGTSVVKLIGYASITSLNEYFTSGGFVLEDKNFVTVHSIASEYWVGLSAIVDHSLDIPLLSQDRDLQWGLRERGLYVFY